MWINLPPTSSTPSRSAPEEPASSLELRSLWDNCALDATSNGKPMRFRTFFGLWTRTSWLKLLYGRISEPSTASRGVEAWIASWAVIPANRSRSLAEDLDETIQDICGRRSIESLAKSNRHSVFSRTCPPISASDSTRSPETLKDWAIRLRLASGRRRKLARATSESACSSWATPIASIATGAGLHGSQSPNLQTQVSLWPTPIVHGNANKPSEGTESGTGLRTAAVLWTTPMAQDGESPETWLARREMLKAAGQNGNGCGTPLAIAAMMWPTPTTSRNHNKPGERTHGGAGLPGAATNWPTLMARDGKSSQVSDATLNKGGRPLNEIAVNWSTPRATDGEKGGPNQSFGAGGTPLPTQACQFSRQVPESSTDGVTSLAKTKRSLRLSPRFTCWLMGWPLIGRDYSVCSETEWSLYRLRLRSALSGLLSGNPPSNQRPS